MYKLIFAKLASKTIYALDRKIKYMLSMTPENLPVLTEIGSFQHRKELAKLRGRARGVRLQREQFHLEDVFRPSFSHSVASLSVTASPSVVLTSPAKAQPTPVVIFLLSTETDLPRHAGA